MNASSVALNLGGGRQGYRALTMNAEEYLVHTGYAFIPPHKSKDYPPKWGPPNSKGSEPKVYDKIKLFSDAVPP